ncbi:TetR/AcrR family transcriptional regulator [Arthrobacter monumenti]
MSQRFEHLLDAAIEVLAAGGARHLTHRAVDAQAGLAPGSASNLFRTRDSLLTGVLQRILEREMAVWGGLTIGLESGDIGKFSEAMGRLVEELSDEHRGLTQARQAVFVEATSNPVLCQEIHNAREEMSTWAVPALVSIGSSDPATHLRCLLALVDGLLISQLIEPATDFAPAKGIDALLRGLTQQ